MNSECSRPAARTRREFLVVVGAVGAIALTGCGGPNPEEKPVSKLIIVAHIHAKPENESQVRAELEKLIPITRAEEGCIQYDLHRDNEDPAHFMFYETWASRDLWQTHMNAPHLAAYMKATDGMVAEFTLHEMTKIA